MPDPTDLDLDAIEARANAATPGKWKRRASGKFLEVICEDDIPIVHWMGFDDSTRSRTQHNKNVAFIAASRTDVELLCREVRALRQRVAELEKQS